MSRSNLSDKLAENVNKEWKKWQAELPEHDINLFIDWIANMVEIFDVEYLNDTGYALFHLIKGGQVYTVYYWQNRNEWFAKH